ncbi:hypothetical protein PCANC_02850 [Puccinia coronata f. sp. avenae]|uniref:Uncharacterized protein n=1 Tax=Puccinia coronata f. sp. avenae TaxID=200324 RepID=A0A2N5W3W1_9BASI|nr:hypothetical protein PCANC_02850 [Puccinia coronata f. sp. avenae]
MDADSNLRDLERAEDSPGSSLGGVRPVEEPVVPQTPFPPSPAADADREQREALGLPEAPVVPHAEPINERDPPPNALPARLIETAGVPEPPVAPITGLLIVAGRLRNALQELLLISQQLDRTSRTLALLAGSPRAGLPREIDELLNRLITPNLTLLLQDPSTGQPVDTHCSVCYENYATDMNTSPRRIGYKNHSHPIVHFADAVFFDLADPAGHELYQTGNISEEAELAQRILLRKKACNEPKAKKEPAFALDADLRPTDRASSNEGTASTPPGIALGDRKPKPLSPLTSETGSNAYPKARLERNDLT